MEANYPYAIKNQLGNPKTNAYNRSFPCMEATYPYAGLLMPELVLYGIHLLNQ